MKVGDKVRFLNEVGGGVVSALGPKNMVTVLTDDGFDMPVLASECVVIEPAPAKGAASTPAPQSKAPKSFVQKAPQAGPAPQATVAAPAPVAERREGELLNLMLAFVPVDPQHMQATTFEAYFINDSNYQVDFTWLTSESTMWQVKFRASAEPNTKIFIDEFSYEALAGLEHSCIQLLAYKPQRSFRLKPAMTVRLRIDGTRFYHAGAFAANDFFDEAALLVDVVRDDQPVRSMFVDAQEMKEALMQKKMDDEHPHHAQQSKPAHGKNEIIEVDLHASSLLDTTAGMKSGEILNYQLDVFRRVMNEQRGHKGQRIVFIHGKGEGVLRHAVIEELRTKYKTCDYQDASFREYGFGATMVTIH